ncbi:hypothetical protein MSAN_01824100 [Mycena sanguinolenta]|uniref:CxC2-like cysteine cluster KDZ transposase-associated domain-containing protein n=1 Tax=Mycena sanguinolenta TaxID=230812 RepID=A0A8H6XUW2_9AGAR|nr:hypothetical protein MSAN_01824100 [Mycena sanguinolenta]
MRPSKRKKITTINFALSTQAANNASNKPTAASTTSTTNILREKTTIRQDGATRQKRSMVSVTTDHLAPKAHDDIQIRLVAPIYEPFSTGDHGGEDYDDDDGGRDLRDSDNPLRQWAEDHRETFLAEMLRHEGRGEHARSSTCPQCREHEADHRCVHCMGGGELLCRSCIVAVHRQLPFHTIQRWTGLTFERRTLKDLGLRIQLGHWHELDRICPLPQPAAGNDFVIIDTHGVHSVNLDFCNCGLGGAPTVQLLRARLWPATTTNPRTAATFTVLRRHHLLSLESKCAALEFYQSLARESDNLHYKKNKDRYHEFLRITRQWRNVQMLKRAGRGHDPGGISATKPGECALLCPACPHPGINLPPGWRDVPKEKRFLYALFLALDANFRLKRKDVSSEEKDPGLGNGWAFYCEVNAYMNHVRLHWNDKQERSHCVAHDAVDKPDREARGTASSEVGAVDCARHNMKRPKAVGDLQLGERYINMDYMFFHSIVGTDLVRFFVSYDIACQWHLNIWTRMVEYDDATLTLPGRGKFLTFLVPKFHLPAHIEACNLKYSFNLTRFVGQTDGEAPERGWADANPLARSTKEMGPGFRRDTLDDHFNDWNHKKTIGLGYMLRRKVEKAVPEMVKTQRALDDMNESLGRQSAEVVGTWTKMAETWEEDIDNPNPFETLRKDQHVAHVRAELAAEAAAREVAGQEDDDAVRGDMHITELIAMGLQLEEQQRILSSDISATGLHPTAGQRRAMTERTSKLRRKIFAWMDVQHKFFPALANVRAREDERRARAADGQSVPGVAASDIALWLPSAVLEAPGKVKVEIPVRRVVYMHEYRLRVAQAAEALHDVRRQLLVRTHLYKLKDTHARGVRANMRSSDKIAALNDQIKRAACTYRAARKALVALGHELNQSDWERTLLPLAEDDIRGLPQSHFHDPERKKEATKKKKKRARTAKKPRELSWIWVSRGEEWKHGDDAAMNEAVRIEWAKTRARAMRWAEEVDLLEEEMRRVKDFLRWRSEWWTARVDGRQPPAGPQREGEAAYATRQAAICATMAAEFTKEWEALAGLIRRGRAGVLVEEEEVEEEAEEEDSDSGEEEEAIPKLPPRTVKPTYVDDVLVM